MKARINPYGYHALALESEEYAYCDPISGLNLTGKTDFTFSIQFLARYVGQEIVLFSQGDNVTIGWKKGAFFCETKAGRISANQWSMPIEENEWNQFDLVCKDTTLKFYLNGIPVYEEKLADTGDTATDQYHFGDTLDGFIRYVRLAEYALTQEEIFHNQYQQELSKEKLAFCFDFTGSRVKDLGRCNISLVYEGFADVKDIVPVLSPGANGIVMPAVGSHQPNPGGFKSGAFTLWTRIFLTGNPHQDMTVVANGDDSMGLVLKVLETGNVGIIWGGLSYTGRQELPTYTWLDLSVTFTSGNLVLYINNDMDSTWTVPQMPSALSEGSIRIGNQMDSGQIRKGMGFHGYIDAVAVYDRALSQESISAFETMIPYIYDTGLSALYQFGTGAGREILGNTDLLYSGDAQQIFATNTMRVDEIGGLQFSAGTASRSYTEFEQWEANTIATIAADFISEQTGIPAVIGATAGVPLAGAQLDYFVNRVVPLDSAQDILAHNAIVSQEEVQAFLEEEEAVGDLEPLIRTSFSGSSAAVTTQLSSVAKAEITGKLAEYAAPIAVIALAVASLLNTHTPIPPQPTPPEPAPDEKFRYLSVKSIRFSHDKDFKTSAIPLALSGKEKYPSPEWKTSENSKEKPSHAAYVCDKVETPYIHVEFEYKTNYTDSVSLSVNIIESGDQILKSSTELSLDVSGSGTYSMDILLNTDALKKSNHKRLSPIWNWSWTFADHKQFMGDTYHKVYIIPSTPVTPWIMDDDDLNTFVTVDALDFFMNMMDWARKEKLDGKEIPAIAVHYMIDGDIGKANSEQKSLYGVALLMEQKITFDKDRFYKTILAQSTEIIDLDAALMVADIGTLCGIEMIVGGIISTADALKVIDKEQRIYEELPWVFFEKSYTPGKSDAAEIEGISTHYIAVRKKENDPLLYDGYAAVVGNSNEKQYAEGLPFTKIESSHAGDRDSSSYRESWVICGSSAILPYSYTIRHDEITSTVNHPEVSDTAPYKGLQLIGNFFIVLTKDRKDFDNVMDVAVPTGAGQDKCHFVSYRAICDNVAACLNDYISRGYANAIIDGLKTIIDMVYLNFNQIYDDSFKQGAYNLYQRIVSCINAGGFSDMKKVLQYANGMIDDLNNSSGNLRAGNSSWNRSVGSCFDPSEWCYIKWSRGIARVYADQNSICYPGGTQIPVGLPAFPPLQDGLFLTSKLDSKRIQFLKYLQAEFNCPGPSVYKASDTANLRCSYIYSSNNAFPIPPKPVPPTTVPIYYRCLDDPNTGAEHWEMF